MSTVSAAVTGAAHVVLATLILDIAGILAQILAIVLGLVGGLLAALVPLLSEINDILVSLQVVVLLKVLGL